MDIEFKVIDHGSKEWQSAVELREKILRHPLGSSFTQEELDEEKDQFNIAGFLGDEIVATSVLVQETDAIKMQRVVVSNELRNKSIGSDMMKFCETITMSKGFDTIYCHARDSAVRFYQNNLYLPVGEYFLEDGIPHLKMTKKLNGIKETT